MCVTAPLEQMLHAPALSDASSSPEAMVARDPCGCETSVYLCLTCGFSMFKNDASHKRLWDWRTWYRTNLLGIGTGIGGGNLGVTCARRTACLGAQEAEVETVLGSETGGMWPTETFESLEGSTGHHMPHHDGENKPGYFLHEMEGIGGVVKKKLTHHIRVAKAVPEFEDERDRSKLLERERKGETRSWCGWCDRVILGHADLRLLHTSVS